MNHDKGIEPSLSFFLLIPITIRFFLCFLDQIYQMFKVNNHQQTQETSKNKQRLAQFSSYQISELHIFLNLLAYTNEIYSTLRDSFCLTVRVLSLN